MTNFEILYNGVQKVERGYDAYDQGAPAYCGINRAFHYETWKSGWKFLDKKKAEGKLKQGAFFPELEPQVKSFYNEFWKPVQVNKLKDLKIAQLLVDMKTQHGRWASIINAGLYGKDPIKAPLKYGDAEIQLINSDSAKYYRQIAEARLLYVKGIKLKDERDRKGIIARAQSYVTDALKYVNEHPGKSSRIALGLFFFLMMLTSRNNGK